MLALGQHLDDLAESFVMSAFNNGRLRTMKARSSRRSPAQSAHASDTQSSNASTQANPGADTAIFAGGCFWCIEADFEKLPGVIEAVSGYTGGHVDNPTYKQVVREDTGHYEAVKVIYDPAAVTYPELVSYFWRHVDPTDPNGQFCDKGDSYRTAIFARPDQLSDAQASKSDI